MSINGWMKRMWHIYAMECCSAMERGEVELFVVRWMDLESVVQSEVGQRGKDRYCMLARVCGI